MLHQPKLKLTRKYSKPSAFYINLLDGLEYSVISCYLKMAYALRVCTSVVRSSQYFYSPYPIVISDLGAICQH